MEDGSTSSRATKCDKKTADKKKTVNMEPFSSKTKTLRDKINPFRSKNAVYTISHRPYNHDKIHTNNIDWNNGMSSVPIQKNSMMENFERTENLNFDTISSRSEVNSMPHLPQSSKTHIFSMSKEKSYTDKNFKTYLQTIQNAKNSKEKFIPDNFSPDDRNKRNYENNECLNGCDTISSLDTANTKKGHINNGFVISSDDFDESKREKNEIISGNSDNEIKPKILPQLLGSISSACVHLAIGCVVGYTGVTLPSLMDPESEDIVLDKFQASLFSSIVNIGALFGSLLSSLMMTWLGQRMTLLVYLPIGMAFWTMMAVSRAYWLLVLSRTIQGIVIGVSAGCANNYVVEIAHQSVRGRLFALIDMARQVGFLFMYIVGSTSLSWRNVALICGLISMGLPFFSMIFLPHSPRWLCTRGRKAEARKSLVFFRGSDFDVDTELTNIENDLERSSSGGTVFDQLKMLKEKSIAIRFGILAFLLFASHFTGNFALIAYSVSIFQSANVDINPYLCTIVVACARILGVTVYMSIADKFSRRKLLMIPLLLSGVSMFVLGFFFFVKALGGNTNPISYIPLTSIIFYVILTMMSHPVLMLLRSELLPTSVRSVGVGLLYWFFFCGTFGVSISYPYMVDSVGSHWTFWLYGFTSCTMVAVSAIFIPETQGKSLEDIGNFFDKNKSEKNKV